MGWDRVGLAEFTSPLCLWVPTVAAQPIDRNFGPCLYWRCSSTGFHTSALTKHHHPLPQVTSVGVGAVTGDKMGDGQADREPCECPHTCGHWFSVPVTT